MVDQDAIRRLLDQGLTFYGLGRVNEALNSWNKVLAMDPDNTKAKEYLNFVQQNWGPPPREEPAEPYRPDEGSDGSGQIQAPPLPETPATARTEEKETFGVPTKPILESTGWGDLYDFGGAQKAVSQPKIESLEAPAPDMFKPDSAPAAPESELEPAPPPAADVPETGWGEFSRTAQPAEQPAEVSTLPPHPEPQAAEEPIELDIVVEEAPAAATDKSVFSEAPAVTPDEAAVTKEYESLPAEVLSEPSQVVETPFDLASPPEAAPEPALEPLPSDSDGGRGALDLVSGQTSSAADYTSPGPAESEVETWLRGARDLLELDDFSGAVELLEKVLRDAPDHDEARNMRDEAENQLLGMLSSKLGNLNKVPRVQMAEDEIIWLNYDHRAGFVLSLVDGELSFDEIISISGVSQLECMRFLVQFLQDKVIKAS